MAKQAMTVEIKKDAKSKKQSLVITIPMVEQVSKSGKSIIIATTGGNKNTGLEYKGKEIVLGVNAYIPVDITEE